MNGSAYEKLVGTLNEYIQPLDLANPDYSDLLGKIDDSHIVLIGEATHGTKEFYEVRANITQELITKKGFMAIAVEGDWPDAYHVNKYIQEQNNTGSSEDALGIFKRFPTWMWANKTIANFLTWLKNYNNESSENKIGFYGLDLYSLNNSMQAVLDYLNKVDPAAAKHAAKRYACFDHVGGESQKYGQLVALGLKKDCIRDVVEQLLILQHHEFDYLQKDGLLAQDEFFYATQNARLVKNAEHYYRAMFEGRVNSWNIRDQHMMETINALIVYLEKRFNLPAKIVVWAHNSHVGDARATEMSDRGEINLGQLVREQFGASSYSIGFSTYKGTVTAADNWGELPQSFIVRPGLEGSYEKLLHELHNKQFILDLHKHPDLEYLLIIQRLQRAIGVIYRPETERTSHYFLTCLPYQFDSLIHIDTTNALEPLRSCP